MMKVFIVILNWKRFEETRDCLEFVEKMTIPKKVKLSVVVVDNNSQDGSVEKLKKIINKFSIPGQTRDDLLTVIENDENLGFAGGNNSGINYALQNGADWVMVLNNDTRVDKELLINFIEASERYEGAGIISPKIYFEKGYEFHNPRLSRGVKKYKKEDLGRVIWYAGGETDWDNVYGKNRGVDEVDGGQYGKSEEIDFATGACLFVRAEALSRVGLFNEDYFMYMEDVELSMRMKKADYKVLYYPKAVLWHKVAQSSGIGSGLNDYFLSRNRLLFGMKYANLRTKIALVRESLRLLFGGREWQKKGVRDYYLGKFGKGSWK